MTRYAAYLEEIKERKEHGLHPKPIDSGDLLSEIIAQVTDPLNPHRKDSLQFLIYNTLPGTTSAAAVKSEFLKEIILGKIVVPEISAEFAFEQLSQMKGGPSVRVLLDIALEGEETKAAQAAEVLKT